MDTSALPVADEAEVAADYLPGVRGHAVLATGKDIDGREAVAVWRLGPTGGLNGAWIFSRAAVNGDDSRFESVIQTLAGRCIIGWTEESVRTVLHEIGDRIPAGLTARLSASIGALPRLLDEILHRRRECVAAVDDYRMQTKSKLVPLSWARDLPELADAAHRVVTPTLSFATAPVAAEALSVVGSLQSAVALWQDTEQVRYRRPYLRALGEVQSLPPLWLSRLRAVASA